MSSASSRIHVPDVVRGIMLLVGLAGLTWVTAMNDRLALGPVAWVVYLATMGAGVAAALRIVTVDAIAPRDPAQRVERTRQSTTFIELVIAGVGALFLMVPSGFIVFATSEEVSAYAHDSSPTIIGVLFTIFFGVIGFYMMFWRPQFLLDGTSRTVTRYAFARSLPFRTKVTPTSEVTVFSEGYYITNTGHRLGDVIRGRAGDNTFELELLQGSLDRAFVQQRTMQWATALGASYVTPELQGIQALYGTT